MKRRVALAATLALSIAAASAAPALAQVTPPPRPTPSEPDLKKTALLDAQKAAFLEMSEPDRKAVQDALGWLGLYNGVVDGAFGKRTLDAILAYQSTVKATDSGAVSTAQLAALKAAAQKARGVVGFLNLDDARTGIRIGAPMKLLEKRSSMGSQTQMTNRDGSVSLDLLAPPGAQGSLAALYGKLSAETPERKITSKAMTASGASAQTTAGAPLEPGNMPTPVPSPAPSEPILTATALIVAPGQAATVLTEAECKTPSIGGKPVKFVRADASGLALLGGDFGGAAPSLRLGVGAKDVIVLSLAPGNGAGKTILEASDANLAPISGTREAIVTALSKSARGAPAFDREGALVAFVAPLSAEPKRRGAVVLAEPHELVAAGAAEGLVPWANAESAAGAPMGAADIARKMRGAITGVFCTP
jgi:hypothetical protein